LLRKDPADKDIDIEAIYERHGATVYRVCFAFLKNPADAEDAAADTFLRLLRARPALAGEEHEKAWLIRTAANVSKNVLRHWWRRRESLEDHTELQADGGEAGEDDALRAVLALPDKYKAAVILYYYEGYAGAEVAAILGKPHSTVRNQLRAARLLLRETLGGEIA
jgi:RNA polymerase sigma-70 factor (ECF subfamily)